MISTDVELKLVSFDQTVKAEGTRFSQVLPSTYTLSVTKTGFREYVQSGLALSSNQSVELNLALEVGAVSEKLEVSAAAPLSDTQASNKSGTLNTNMVEHLPVPNRAALSLVTATLAGGTIGYGLSTIFGSSAADDQNVARFNLFGGRQNTTAILIFGVPATASDWGGLISEPGADTVQELQVIRNTYEAQYGRSGAGLVNRQHPENKDWMLTNYWPDWDISSDYAIVTRMLDATADRPVIIAAGLTQYGTVGASELLSNPDYFSEAARHLPPDWRRKNLQIVLRVPVVNRIAGRPRILASHVW